MTSTYIFNRYGHGKGEYVVRFYIIKEERERYITSASFEIL
jgi:hypothetical protein